MSADVNVVNTHIHVIAWEIFNEFLAITVYHVPQISNKSIF